MDVIYLLVAVGLWLALAGLVLACMDTGDRAATPGRPPAGGAADTAEGRP